MKNKVIIILAFNLALLLTWRLFSLFLSNDKIYPFPFYDGDHPWVYPSVYIYYISQYIREASVLYALWLSTRYYIVKSVVFAYILLVFTRLAVYLLFKGTLDMTYVIGVYIIGSIIALFVRWQK